MDKVTILELTLHHELVGYLAGFGSGKNILLFADSFRANINRPTLGLVTNPVFLNSAKLLTQDWVSHQRLHPILSNLLPEGALRELLVQGLKTHIDNEFQLFAALGHDLPGGLIAKQLKPEQIPEQIQHRLQLSDISQITDIEMAPIGNKFSLAGVQMKFSMREQDGRFNLTQALASRDSALLGDWIIKTPSTRHAYVPLNEYTAMTLAKIVGVDIPEIRLVEMSQLDHLPPINLPQEQYAFAIRRFDRLTTA
ncbi:MAG TPA: HipA domain-containing protein, partial [Aquirhabdus sp.]